MKKASELRQRAERYRRLKMQINDPTAVLAICDLAGELETTAAGLEQQHLIRKRAHDIWIQQGRPEGRDVEFWLAAERELEGGETRSSAGVPETERSGAAESTEPLWMITSEIVAQSAT